MQLLFRVNQRLQWWDLSFPSECFCWWHYRVFAETIRVSLLLFCKVIEVLFIDKLETGTFSGFFIVNVNLHLSAPKSLVAMTVKLKSPISVGVPEILPSLDSDKPFGNAPLSIIHEMGWCRQRLN